MAPQFRNTPHLEISSRVGLASPKETSQNYPLIAGSVTLKRLSTMLDWIRLYYLGYPKVLLRQSPMFTVILVGFLT
jgi:hypothetical protein